MSRCFPFPPPGYELKARPDDVNLIIKDKQKHKKHKDKKEKDKKERSERKEKERSERKEHKEDKKRKRKEDNNKKDKDKNKDKQSSLGVFLENQNGQKLVPDVVELGKVQEKLVPVAVELGKVQENGNYMLAIKDKELGKVQENGNYMLAIKDKRDHNRNVVELGKVQENGNGTLAIKKDKVEKHKVAKTKEGKERNGYRNMVGEGDGRDKKRKEEKDQIKNTNTKVEDKKREEKKKELMGFSKEKVKQETNNGNFLDFHLNENDDYRGKLPKLKELNGLLDAKDNGVLPDNMSRPAIVSHQAGQTGAQNTIKLGVGKRAVITDQKVNPKLSSPQSVIDSVRNIGPCQTANDTKTENGRVSVNNHVVSNGVISPHIVRIERKVEPYQTSNGVAIVKQIVNRSANGKNPSSRPFAENEVQAPDAFHKMMHNKESRMKGSLESSMPSSASLKGKVKVATTTKPPHPDLKYLSQILAVPEVEWPQCDDQEWLFDHKDSQSKRPKLVSSEIQWTKQVWSEAVELESADVTALPYVIPY